MLPRAFIDRPLAHRGLHNAVKGIIENSLNAFDAAIWHDYGIELDVQISRDGIPVVFHDDDLRRLTCEDGYLADRTAAELATISLKDGAETIPTLAVTLGHIAGRVPVLIEIKDQSVHQRSQLDIAQQVARVVTARPEGEQIAVMSFNPIYIIGLRDLAPGIPRGLTTGPARVFSDLPEARRAELVNIVHYNAAGASFVSHDREDLDNHRLHKLKAKGASILCWTIRGPEEEAAARKVADNVTFEGYLPA